MVIYLHISIKRVIKINTIKSQPVILGILKYSFIMYIRALFIAYENSD